MALNGMSNADAIIRDGQELIIAVPEPELKLRITMGEVYEEDYNEDPVIIENDSWYTTKEVVLEEGTTGHRERNDVVVYENGVEASREMLHENIMVASTAAVIEKGTIIPPTYIKPLSGGHYTSGFGYRWGRLHKGVDWGCPVGTTVYASCGGTVIQAAYSGGYGNVVVISHPDGRMTRYAHNSKLLVKVGQHVEQGEAIALSGSTGNSTGPHVHFEIYINGSAVNPLKYISY
jgi:murein DD-endopeptidase MepM/ murein hydrolase activator NlpD